MTLPDPVELEQLNADYLIAMVTIKQPLDSDECDTVMDDVCMDLAECQFYYLDDNGERAMRTTCFSCLISAIRHNASTGQKIIVEVPA